MQNIEKFDWVLFWTVICALAAVAAVVIGIKQFKLSKNPPLPEIEKPSLEIRFFELTQKFGIEKEINVYYGIKQMGSRDVAQVYFSLCLANISKVTVENIEIIYEFAPLSELAVPDNYIQENIHHDITIGKRKQTKTKDGNFIIYQINALNPSSAKTIQEPLMLYRTDRIIETAAQTKDKENVLIKTHCYLVNEFNIAITGKNIKSNKYKVNVQLLEVENASKLEEYVDSEIREMLDKEKGEELNVPNLLDKLYIVAFLKEIEKGKNPQNLNIILTDNTDVKFLKIDIENAAQLLIKKDFEKFISEIKDEKKIT